MSQDATAPTHPDTSGPIPPRSRHRWHLAGIALTVLAGPLSFLAMSIAAPIFLSQLPASAITLSGGASPALAWLALVLASAILFGTCWIGARSAVAAATSGGFWLACGLLAEFGPRVIDWLARFVPTQALGSRPREGAELLLDSGAVLVIGAALTGIAVAASAARRHGRWMEQVEHHRMESGQVTIPPRSRIAAHISAPILGAVLSVIAIALTNRIASDAVTGGVGATDRVMLLGTALAGFIIAALGALSSLGPAVSAAIWAVSFVQVALLHSEGSAVTELGSSIIGLFEPWRGDPSSGADTIGTTLAVAAVLAGGALGIHLARRDGRSIQRREHELG